jgi:lipoprotein LprG
MHWPHIRRSLTLSRHPGRAVAAVPILAVALLAGCSQGKSAVSPAESAALLTKARTSLDGASTVHFTLTSANVPGGGTRLIGGDGVVARPKAFQGKLSILLSGSKLSIDLISAGGKVYVKLPFSTKFQTANPASFGLSDPAGLIDAKTGISRMFDELTDISGKGDQRIGADVVTELDGSLPGSLVDDLLTSADPTKPVKASLFITKTTGQLRRAVLTGPFFEKTTNSTFTVLLDRYGQNVSITAPAVPK